jgi:hypothetical protein
MTEFNDFFTEWAKNPDVLLRHHRSDWEDTQNPYFVWSAIDVCGRHKQEIPRWVRDYLFSCADRMVADKTALAKDLGRTLPAVLGFQARRGRGNQLRPEGDFFVYWKPAAVFGKEILKGSRPSLALNAASELLDRKIADKIDNKTLLNHIKSFFGVKNAPRTTAGWKEVINDWHAHLSDQLEKEIREFSP